MELTLRINLKLSSASSHVTSRCDHKKALFSISVLHFDIVPFQPENYYFLFFMKIKV